MNLNLNAEVRELGTKAEMNTARKEGRIPAVIYGQGNPGKKVFIAENEFTKQFKKSFGHVTFFNITVDGKEIKTIIKDKQIHPVSRKVLHVDFMELHEGTEISLDIPIVLNGSPVGVKAGGVMENGIRRLHVYSLPMHIKEDIQVDMSHLKIGDSIHVEDLDLGEMKTRTAGRVLVVSVHAVRGAKSADEEDEEEEEAVASEE